MIRQTRREALQAMGMAALAIGAALSGGLGRAHADGADQTLAAPDAHRQALAGEIVLLDIRRPEEWSATGSGEGAVRLDMRRPDFANEVLRLVEGDPSRPIAVICARGNRSAWLSARMSEAGFTSVVDVSEGMMGSDAGPGWLARGLPVRK